MHVGVVVLRCWSQHLSSTFKALSAPESAQKREDVGKLGQPASLSVFLCTGCCCCCLGSLFRSGLESVSRNSFLFTVRCTHNTDIQTIKKIAYAHQFKNIYSYQGIGGHVIPLKKFHLFCCYSVLELVV